DVIEGRGVGESLRLRAEGVGHLLVKPEALRAADGDYSFDVREGELVSFEVAFVGGEKGREGAARGMAADENGIGPAAVLGDVSDGPSKGAGHVLDVCGMLYRGRKAVAGRHEADTLLGEGLAERLGVLTVPLPQGAAVDPEEDGVILPAFR